MKKGDKYFIIATIVWIGLYVLGWVQEWAGVYEFGLPVTVFFIGSLFWVGLPYLIYRVVRYYKERKIKQMV